MFANITTNVVNVQQQDENNHFLKQMRLTLRSLIKRFQLILQSSRSQNELKRLQIELQRLQKKLNRFQKTQQMFVND